MVCDLRNMSISYEGIAKQSISLVNHMGKMWPRAVLVVAARKQRESERA